MATFQPEDLHVRVDRNLTNQPPVAEGIIEQFETIREAAKALGHVIVDTCPDSREKSLALTDLETTVMWAIASLARNQEVPPNE